MRKNCQFDEEKYQFETLEKQDVFDNQFAPLFMPWQHAIFQKRSLPIKESPKYQKTI